MPRKGTKGLSATPPVNEARPLGTKPPPKGRRSPGRVSRDAVHYDEEQPGVVVAFSKPGQVQKMGADGTVTTEPDGLQDRLRLAVDQVPPSEAIAPPAHAAQGLLAVSEPAEPAPGPLVVVPYEELGPLLAELPQDVWRAEALQRQIDQLNAELKPREAELKALKETTEALLVAVNARAVLCMGIRVKQTSNKGREVIDGLKLVEKGVDPAIVKAATVRKGAWTSVEFVRVEGEAPDPVVG